MSEWREGTLSDIAEFEMGQSPEGDTCNGVGTGVPLLNGPTEFGIRNPKAVQFTTDPKRFSKSGDILFCVRGSTTGKMNWSDQDYAIGRGLAALRHKKGSEFKYYLKAVLDFNLDLLLASATGSTFPNVSKNQIASLEVSIPPPEEQKAISSVLSSLDDKIDLLNCQNTTLISMAESLFRQWFVKEAQGDWEEYKVSELASHIKLGVNPSANPLIEYHHYSLPAFDEGQKPVVELGTEILSNKYKVPNRSILVSKLNPRLPRIWSIGDISTQNAICSTEFQVFIPKQPELYAYLYFLFGSSDAKDALEMAASGTSGSHQRVRPEDILNITTTLPSLDLAMKYSEITNPFLDKMIKNRKQIQTLEKLRDTLLPKLMSGEITIKTEVI